MRFSGRVLFSVVVAAAAAWALAETAGWPLKTALYPRVVALPVFVLAVTETVLSLRRPGQADEVEAIDVALTTEVPAHLATRRTGMIAAWLGGFLLAGVLIGFPRAIPLFVLAFLKGQAREGWVLSLILTAAAWLGFHQLFIRLLHVPFADGLLWGAIFR